MTTRNRTSKLIWAASVVSAVSLIIVVVWALATRTDKAQHPSTSPDAVLVQKDSQFLTIMRDNQIVARDGNSQELTNTAYKICHALANDEGQILVEQDIQENAPSLSDAQVHILVGTAISIYCPGEG